MATLGLVPDRIVKAAIRGVNRTVTYARSRVNREIRQGTPLPLRLVAARLRVYRANPNVPQAAIIGSYRPIRLDSFKPWGSNYDVMYLQGGRTISLPHAFFWKVQGPRSKLVWLREPGGSHASGLVPRLPIKVQYGPSVAQLLASVLPGLQTDITAEFLKRLDREAHYEFLKQEGQL
jgi:hypothetical protein